MPELYCVYAPITLPETGTPILHDDGTHICAPFCTACSHRLVADASVRLTGAEVSVDGWDDHTADMSCEEINGSCVNEACTEEDEIVQLYFCYGAEDDCDKDAPPVPMSRAERIAAAAKNLTVLTTTPGGGVVIGPEGWAQLQEALS